MRTLTCDCTRAKALLRIDRNREDAQAAILKILKDPQPLHREWAGAHDLQPPLEVGASCRCSDRAT